MSSVFTERRGSVASFDDRVGAGTVTDSDGAGTWWFHCTSIADGSRSIPEGTVVSFRIEPGPTGVEATRIRPAGPPGDLPGTP